MSFTNHSLQISPKQFNFQAGIVQKYYLMDFETENEVAYMTQWFCMRRNILIFNAFASFTSSDFKRLLAFI